MQLRDRVRGALDALARTSPGKVIIVTHGGVLDTFYRIAVNAPLDAPRTWQLLNASVNQIKVDEGKWELGAWGDITHLPATEDDFG